MVDYFVAATVNRETQGFDDERLLIEATKVTNHASQALMLSLDPGAKNDARPTMPGGKM